LIDTLDRTEIDRLDRIKIGRSIR